MERLVYKTGKLMQAVPIKFDLDFVFDLDEHTWDGLQEIFNKLFEYEDLEKDGKLVKLPCKIGDELYGNIDIGPFGERLLPIKVSGISLHCVGDYGDVTTEFDVDIEDVGKTVFLTREEAEEKNNNNNNNK